MESIFRVTLYFISFVEGGVLIANELICSKLISTSFGNSITVWAIILTITLLSLALGYYFGAKIFDKSKSKTKTFIFILVFFAFAQILQNYSSEYFESKLISYSLFSGSLIYGTIILFPIVFLAGIFSPFVIGILQTESIKKGTVAGQIYGVSTLGGVLASFYFGLIAIPELGLNYSYTILNIILIGILIIYFIVFFLQNKNN